MDRFVCVHGHFYQPPRENPWLEAIELQDGAYPYHDWNERITAECYATNAASRILDRNGRIGRIVNNYSKMSFNFGPTLLKWMEEKAPDTYRAILAADEESRRRFSGHGSALAQAYGHMILPLANRRDKVCQVVWGMRDFEHRFGRKPEGMWLPETAADLESLEVLAEQGIRFTILAPSQAHRVRPARSREWRDVTGGRIDPTRPYEQKLPSGRSIALFFYDGPVSRAVAFEGLLGDGARFADRITSIFSSERDGPQLAHIATDGETYGHHHRYGDMALAYGLHHVEATRVAALINYGAFLERFPPADRVEILDGTSWSCAHGVERWRADCGCNSGAHPGWRQAWRGPLRGALDWLRDELAPLYESHAAVYLRDPWRAREDYIDVILDRSPESQDRFLARSAVRGLTAAERVTVWKLMELQRHAMLMYTSCGWFFDELSGIETVQVIQYAARALQLAHQLTGRDLAPGFLERLEQAPSNLREHRNGREIYEKFVRPAMVDLKKVAAHYAVSSLFEEYEKRESVFGFVVDREDRRLEETGRSRFALGRMRVRSVITGEEADLSYGVLHLGDHNISGGVREYQGTHAYKSMIEENLEAFSRADHTEVVRLLDKHFLELTYSLKSLFRDEQRKILDLVLRSTLDDAEAVYRRLYDDHVPLTRFLGALGIPLPQALRSAAELVLNADLRRALEGELAPERVTDLLKKVREAGVSLDREGLGFAFQKALERTMEEARAEVSNLERLGRIERAVRIAASPPFEVSLWKVQNLYHEILEAQALGCRDAAERGDEMARRCLERLRALGEALHFQVD